MFATIQAVETRVSALEYIDNDSSDGNYSITLSRNCSKHNFSCTEFCEITIDERDYDTTDVNFYFDRYTRLEFNDKYDCVCSYAVVM